MSGPKHPSAGSHAFSAHPRRQAELARLKRQALAVWPDEARWLARLGLNDGLRVLDVGCGAGFVTEKLAELNPGGETLGLEPDPVLAAIAEKRFAARAGLSLHIGSLSDHGLALSYFDFAYARFVFQHVAEPLEALRRLRQLLKPGGRAVLVDADDGLNAFYPQPPELSEIMQLLETKQTRAGGDRRIGRKLPSLLDRAGFAEVGFELLPFTSHRLGRRALVELAVSSRLVRLDRHEMAAVNPLLQRMDDFFAKTSWHGLACVMVAFARR